MLWFRSTVESTHAEKAITGMQLVSDRFGTHYACRPSGPKPVSMGTVGPGGASARRPRRLWPLRLDRLGYGGRSTRAVLLSSSATR